MPVVSIKLAGRSQPRAEEEDRRGNYRPPSSSHALKPRRYTYIAFEELPDENWAMPASCWMRKTASSLSDFGRR